MSHVVFPTLTYPSSLVLSVVTPSTPSPMVIEPMPATDGLSTSVFKIKSAAPLLEIITSLFRSPTLILSASRLILPTPCGTIEISPLVPPVMV